MIKKYSAEIVDQKLWIKQGDETWCYDVLDIASEGIRRKKTSSISPDKIVSLMPGKITKMFVKEGDSVTQGQALVVMEAMKMEYTLKSDLSTTVEKVNVELGQQVTLGQLLVQLKKV
ncbi:MAG: biotin/lipoyl-binding protein [Moraxellaceae bacterium]|nr:biotin/lipoyl-binding protein [Pseudobdellovibrionaceae bacterium]